MNLRRSLVYKKANSRPAGATELSHLHLPPTHTHTLWGWGGPNEEESDSDPWTPRTHTYM